MHIVDTNWYSLVQLITTYVLCYILAYGDIFSFWFVVTNYFVYFVFFLYYFNFIYDNVAVATVADKNHNAKKVKCGFWRYMYLPTLLVKRQYFYTIVRKHVTPEESKCCHVYYMMYHTNYPNSKHWAFRQKTLKPLIHCSLIQMSAIFKCKIAVA